MERALRNYQVAGLPNNIDFLVQCVRHHGFAVEQPTTAFFDHYLDGILTSLESSPITQFDDHVALASCAYIQQQRAATIGNNKNSSIWTDYSKVRQE